MAATEETTNVNPPESSDSFNQSFFETVQQQINARRALLLAVRPDMDAKEALIEWLLDDDFQRTQIDAQLPYRFAKLRMLSEGGDMAARARQKQITIAYHAVQRFNQLDPCARYEMESAMWYFEPLNEVTLG